MTNRFQLTIIVPEKVYLDKSVDSLSVVTSQGALTILAHHVDFIANIEISMLTIRDQGKVINYAVSGGIMNIFQKENKVLLLVNAIESTAEIDEARAKAAEKRAEERLAEEGLTLREQQKAEIKLKRALNRLKVAANK